MRPPSNSITLLTAIAIATAIQLLGGCSWFAGQPSDADQGVKTVSIPNDAQTVDEGTGVLKYTARNNGQIYVLDTADGAAVFDYHLNRGQEFVLTPDRNRATVDDKKVFNKDLKRYHVHRLYFLTEERRHRGAESGLPQNIKPVVGGKGVLSYRASGDGSAYVYDSDAQKVVIDTHLRRGQNLVVDPAQNRITVDGNAVSGADISGRNELKIYFEQD